MDSPEPVTATQTQQPAPQSPFELLGGRDAVQLIVNRFYDIMDSDTAYAELRAMHAADLSPMRDSLAGFLTGWMGGPRDWFNEKPGRCVMSAHANLKIDPRVGTQWIDAMVRAIDDTNLKADSRLLASLKDTLRQMARGMVRPL